MTEDKGFMNSYSTKTFQKIHEELVNTNISKYCGGYICVIGSYNDSIVEEVLFNKLDLVDIKFGKCNHTSDIRINYFEMDVEEFLNDRIKLGIKYNTIIMCDVIEHLSHRKACKVLNNIKSILVPNGIFILTYPNCRSTNRLLGVEMGFISTPSSIDTHDRKVGHVIMYSHRSLPFIREMLDMKLIENIGIMFKPLTNSMMDKYFKNDLNKFIEIGKEIGIQACATVGGVFKNVS